jgi:hypothetical protein
MADIARQRAPLAPPAPARQPRPAPAQRRPARLAATPGAAQRAPAPLRALLRAPGPGEPLPGSVATPIARSLGMDLAAVRVHSDARAAVAADLVSARAFTFGSHIFLGAGARATDLGLMAHETAHVVQQQEQSEGPRVQLFDGSGDRGLELEARRAAVAVARGEPVRISGRSGGAAVQREEDDDGSVRGRVLGFIRDHAKQIPGYDLICFVLGRDPITQQPVERTAVNLIRAVAAIIPGGAALFDNLMQSGVIQKAGEWFTAEVAKLGFSWEMIRGLFSQAWDELGFTDLFHPSRAWEKIKSIFGPPVERLVDFAIAAGKKLMEFVFEGALALAGGAGQRVLAIFRKIGDAFGLIVADPVAFLGNLLNAVKGGFNKFVTNIVDHLKRALFEWLTGALAGAITLPGKWDLRGIVSVVLQVLGLTYHRMREKLVKLVGEPAVRAIETAFDFIKSIVTGGLGAAWQKLLEFAGGLVETVVAGIRDWAVTSIVKSAVTKIVTMFNPVGALIQGVITIYNTVMFFVERAEQIAALVESIVDSIANIATGNIGAAVDYVENTLGRTLPVILSFLARLIGLGSVGDAVKGIIAKVQGVVSGAIDRVVGWVVKAAGGILARLAGKTPGGTRAGDQTPDPRRAALTALTARLRDDHTVEQARSVVAEVANQLKPSGLKRLELGNPQADGSFTILAEASPVLPLARLVKSVPAPRGRSVRVAAEITLDAPSVVGAATLLPVADSATVPRGGAVLAQDPRRHNVVQVVTWNTSDIYTTGNSSHAEHQLAAFIRHGLGTDGMKRVRRIEVNIFSFSPCSTCSDELRTLLRDIGAARSRPFNASSDDAKLSWTTLYLGIPPGGINRTTPQSINELSAAGWRLYAPGNALPTAGADLEASKGNVHLI